jgi:hypothetical protein
MSFNHVGRHNAQAAPASLKAIPLVPHTDALDADFFLLGLGVSAVYKGGSEAFLTCESALGLKDVTRLSDFPHVNVELVTKLVKLAFATRTCPSSESATASKFAREHARNLSRTDS